MPHTDSQIVEHHDDGSWTVTTIENHTPTTKADQAKAWGVLSLLAVVSLAPLTFPWVADKLDERRARKDEARKLEVVKD